MEVPNVKRKDYQLIGMDDDFLSLMDDSGDTRDDLKCPPEDNDVGKEVRDAIANEADILVSAALVIDVSRCCCNTECYYNTMPQVTVLSACGEECVIATKVNTAVDK